MPPLIMEQTLYLHGTSNEALMPILLTSGIAFSCHGAVSLMVGSNHKLTTHPPSTKDTRPHKAHNSLVSSL